MNQERKEIVQFINLQLAALGQPIFQDKEDAVEKYCNPKFEGLTNQLIKGFKESSRLLSGHLCPADQRIQSFLNDYLKDTGTEIATLPNNTLILTQEGHAREISLPPDGRQFKSVNVTSDRLKQGILNNPIHDKRTTKGTFHIVEGPLPVPLDKKEVPKVAFAHMIKAAFSPDNDLTTLPFTSNQEEKARLMVSMLLRPLVVPEVKGLMSEKRMEVRFFAPGSLVSNLDFVETIFGNAGDPKLAENDAALDVDRWTGTTGCIVLAPQLLKLKKKDIGLPHVDQATERQKNDGMFWTDPDEYYNDGGAFKITCRDDRGVVVTLIADNYYGYSKKEIKTQISYSANLFGLVEEEHAGGAIAYPRRVMGEWVDGVNVSRKLQNKYSFEDTIKLLGNQIDVKPEYYGVDKKYPNLIYIPEMAFINTATNDITWEYKGRKSRLILSPDKTYIHPTGNKYRLEKHAAVKHWRIVRTFPEGIFCHKPCTVSGGGKSEISKSMKNAITYNRFNIENIEEDFKKADEIIEYDFSKRWRNYDPKMEPSKGFLHPKRTLGSAVRLLVPSDDYREEYNDFVKAIPAHIRSLVLFVKRLYRQDHHTQNWKDLMSVEIINGVKGTGLLYNNAPVIGSYVRIGFNQEGTWMLHKLRSDFSPSEKIQTEDDITASITVPRERLNHLNPQFQNKSFKVLRNCEAYLFQRPDEAIVRGYDKQAELDIITEGTFLTNYEKLTKKDAIEIMEDTINFDKYTLPVQEFIKQVVASDEDVDFVLPSHTRIVDGEPTKNPRYLERNIQAKETEASYVGEMGVRLHRKIPNDQPLNNVVNAVLPGRRNNPVDKAAGIRPLAVYNPIHYQETPELFMEFICSLTGKSPSTTGAGSEGALTKGPFNMLTPTSDLNNALLSHILTESHGFSTSAGYVGAESKIDHDISLLIPELWSRLEPEDRDPKNLLKKGCLEKLEDFEFNGKVVKSSRLGYRITDRFSLLSLNKLFDEPNAVFNERMLKPELQGMEDYVDGINNITEAMEKVALNYFKDGSVNDAIPPLQILLHIMAYGHFEGKDISDPALRCQFDREHVINSEWYKKRLELKKQKDVAFHERQLQYLEDFHNQPMNEDLAKELKITERITLAEKRLGEVKAEDYVSKLIGTIGADPLCRK
ncbi:MAG: hypothetical protein JXR10_08615 [Cyclobacteriaceae bacterium]